MATRYANLGQYQLNEVAVEAALFINSTIDTAQRVYAAIPGSNIVWSHLRDTYQENPYRALLELVLVIFTIKYLLAKRRSNSAQANEVALSREEVDELCREWRPEPLAEPLTEEQQHDLDSIKTIVGPVSARPVVEGVGQVMNLASFNFLNMSDEPAIKQSAMEGLRKYGVGTCGPPGFYGTIDVHLELEKALADFLGTEEAIIYSQNFSTISSVIPAFSKRGDIIVADEAVSFAVQKGIQISRSHVRFFKHNDMQDLERVLRDIETENRKKRRSALTRRFIIVEGLYVNRGDIVPLPELIELKKKYKYRLILEESGSFGALGPRGAGATDYFKVPASDVDIITGSMSNALGSSGGFCAGTHQIVDHQRLSGQAYCFSASLPALLAISARKALSILEEQPERARQLQRNAIHFRHRLAPLLVSTRLMIDGDSASPIIHLRLADENEDIEDAQYYLQQIVDGALKQGILLTRARYVRNQELWAPAPSIRIAIGSMWTVQELDQAALAISRVVSSL